MLMPPAPAPQSPSPNYDFIMNDPAKPKRRFNFSGLGLPKPVIIAFGAVLVIFLIIILSSLFSNKGSSKTDQVINALARNQEIIRVNKIVEPLSQNPDTKNLIATADLSLQSQQARLTDLLKKSGTKVGTKTLSKFLDKNTDSQMQAASSNNSLDSTYAAYLKKNLQSYDSYLVAASKGASKNLLPVLSDAYASSQVILSTPQLSTVNGS
jgi:hypothetical protein